MMLIWQSIGDSRSVNSSFYGILMALYIVAMMILYAFTG